MLTRILTQRAPTRAKIAALLLLFFCLASAALRLTPSHGQSMRQATQLLPTHDAFIDPNNPATAYNGQRLELAFSNFPDFVATRRSLLQFDLTTIVDSLAAAPLTVTLLENNINADAQVILALYRTADGWDETTLQWENQPVEGTLVQTMSVAAGFTGAVTFAAPAVGAYLENERSDDQIASFILRLATGDGSLGFGGNLLFEDREGSADGINGNEPALVLPERTPTVTAVPLTTTPAPPATPTFTVTPTTTQLTTTPTSTSATATPPATATVNITVTPRDATVEANFLPFISNK